jgi:hypothetical protein
MNRKLKVIGIGGVFLLLALVCAATAFYYLEVKPGVRKNQLMMLSDSLSEDDMFHSDDFKKATTIIGKNRSTVLTDASIQTGSTHPAESGVALDDLIRHAESVYDSEEQSRREGYLWVDRATSRYVVTLGALNGVLPGRYLTVYDDARKVGRVKVDSAMDVIAYVHPSPATETFLTRKYYRVVLED